MDNDPAPSPRPADPKTKKPNIIIRQMEIDDLALIFHLGEKLFTAQEVPNLYRTWDEYEVTEFFQSDTEFCLVAEIQDKIVGFSLGTTVIKSHSAWKYGYLVWLGVDPDYHGRGIASKLFTRFRDLDPHHRQLREKKQASRPGTHYKVSEDE